MVLKNVAKQATMDVVTGVWTPEAASERVVYEDAAGKDILVEAKAIGPKDMLVFPTYGEQVSVEVSLEGLELYNGTDYVPMNKTFDATGLVVTDGKCTVTYDLKLFDDVTGDVAGNLKFERNHKYQLAIFVMRDNVRIVAVSPQVYEWVDVNLDLVSDPRVTTLGQPITIGGTVWMDRNLGAKSADCEKDWWHTLGYYYEYARNIPFIMDVEVAAAHYYVPTRYKKDNGQYADNDAHYLCYKDGANKDKIAYGTAETAVAYPDYLLFTYDQNGNKVSKYSDKALCNYANYGRVPDGDIVAINPGDKGTYAFIAPTVTKIGKSDYWYDIDNQPVPKGWRLPTAKDVYTIMPENSFHWFFGGNRFRQVGVAVSRNTTGNAQTYAGTYRYQYFYGNFEVDKSAPKTQAWSKPKYKGSGPSDPYQTRIYGIKYPGSAKAYRYMIETHDSDEHNLGYARVYIYPATPNDRFRSDKDEKDAISDDEGTYNLYSSNPQWNLHQFDWDHPSTYIDFPFTGCFNGHYKIYGSDTPHMYLSLFGRDMKYRLMETINMTDNYCMKLSNDGLGFAGTWHSTTGTVRLVRDLESK